MLTSYKVQPVIILLLLATMLPTVACGQETGLNILAIGPNTKSLGFNEAVTSDLNGASAIYTNPANLGFEPASSVTADYSLWINDIINTHAAVNLKRSRSAFGFGLIASEAGNIILYPDGSGSSDERYTLNIISLAGSYAYRWKNLSIGATAQYLFEKYHIYNASGYAFNMGISGRWWSERIFTGITVQNLGRMGRLIDTASDLPTTFRAGVKARFFRFTPPKNEDLPIWISILADYVNPLQTAPTTTQTVVDRDPYVNIAMAFDIAETVSVYGGFKTGNTNRPWSAGSSIVVDPIRVNYAITPFEVGYNTAHSVGIEYQF